MDQLKSIYEDPSQPGSFGGLEALYTEAKRRGIKVTKQNVKNWLIKRQSYTLHKPARKNLKETKHLSFTKTNYGKWTFVTCHS